MIEPFLKWAGGKRWLAGSAQLPPIATYNRYIEPFLGGGAMFFHLQPAKAILSDVNQELIELYSIVRNEPGQLHQLLSAHHMLHSKSHYYDVRASVPTTPVERAARTLYLNRTCWNGLYRVNRKGEFNVPIGTKTNVIFQGETFMEASAALCKAELRCGDFESTLSLANEGDLVFIDPPYTVQHNMNGFLKYNEHIFSWSDQVRLRDAVADVIERGARVLITNADHESVRSLYRDICDYTRLNRASVLSSVASRRGQTTEALFSANL